MRRHYPAEMTREAGGWRVRFHDLPGCGATAPNQEAAADAAAGALLRWLEARLDAGETVPDPTPLDAMPPPAKGAVRLLVPAGAVRLQRVNISIDGLLLARLDRAAAAENVNRSQFISAAVVELLDALEAEDGEARPATDPVEESAAAQRRALATAERVLAEQAAKLGLTPEQALAWAQEQEE